MIVLGTRSLGSSDNDHLNLLPKDSPNSQDVMLPTLPGSLVQIDNRSNQKFSKFARIHLGSFLRVGFARGSIASEATKNAKLRKKRAEAKKSRIDRWPIFWESRNQESGFSSDHMFVSQRTRWSYFLISNGQTVNKSKS